MCKHIANIRHEGTNRIVFLPRTQEESVWRGRFELGNLSVFLWVNIWFPLSMDIILSLTDFIGLFWHFPVFHNSEGYSVYIGGPDGMWSWENIANMLLVLLNLSIFSTFSLSPTILCRTWLFSYIWLSKACIFALRQYHLYAFSPFWALLKLLFRCPERAGARGRMFSSTTLLGWRQESVH